MYPSQHSSPFVGTMKNYGILATFILLLSRYILQSEAFLTPCHGFTRNRWLALQMASNDEPKIEIYDPDDQIAPNNMKVSEIKAELDLRGISYADCFDKESLAAKLTEARASGTANPDIVNQYNKQNMESLFDSSKKTEITDDDIQAAVANDGKLPGGLTPEVFSKLTSNPKVMEMLQSTKMQEAMKLVMSGEVDMDAKLKEDDELREMVEKLNGILSGVME